MRKIKWLFSMMALALTIGVLSAPAGHAAPAATPDLSTADVSINARYISLTTQDAWMRQCATLTCGYHVVPKGTWVESFCGTSNAGINWSFVMVRDENLRAGHVDTSVLPAGGSNPASCNSVGEAVVPRPSKDLWAHSCPAMACGYGVITPGHDVAYIGSTTNQREGYYWSLVLDHDSPNKNLVGWVHTIDL